MRFMGSKKLGKALRLYKEHGLIPERELAKNVRGFQKTSLINHIASKKLSM